MELLYISILVVVIWDYLNFPNEVASMVMDKLTNGRIKRIVLKPPLGCSLCITFWLSILCAYIMYVDWSSLASILEWTILCLINCISTKYILYIINIIENFLDKIIIELENSIK